MLDGEPIAGYKKRNCFEQFVSEVLLLLAVNRLVEGDLVVLDEVLLALLLHLLVVLDEVLFALLLALLLAPGRAGPAATWSYEWSNPGNN